jgi:hypothetical protein
LDRQPNNFDLNDTQDIFLVSSPEDALYVNLRKNEEVDIDELYGVGLMKEVIFDTMTRSFYMLTNKHDDKLGFFVMRFPEDNPNDLKFLMHYKNKLDIDNTNVYINQRSSES